MERMVKVVGALVVAMGLFAEGCGRSEHSDRPEASAKPSLSGTPERQPGAETGLSEKPAETTEKAGVPEATSRPAPPPTIPKVLMDETRRSTFRVWVDQTMPDGQLRNLQGEPVALRSLWGQKVTVLVFWNSQTLSGLEELQDLAKDLLPTYQEKGLRAVGINVGEEAEAAQKALPPAASTLPVLVDPTGQYFAQIAQQSPKPEIPLLPRTYVLDGQGKVLWLDIGYGGDTFRGIQTTVRAALGQ